MLVIIWCLNQIIFNTIQRVTVRKEKRFIEKLLTPEYTNDQSYYIFFVFPGCTIIRRLDYPSDADIPPDAVSIHFYRSLGNDFTGKWKKWFYAQYCFKRHPDSSNCAVFAEHENTGRETCSSALQPVAPMHVMFMYSLLVIWKGQN